MAASLPSWKQAWTGGQATKECEYWGQLEPQAGLELIWSYMQHIFLSVHFFQIFIIKCSCHWNISGENLLLSPTLSWAYWPPVSRDNPLFLFSLTWGQIDHLLHSLKEFLNQALRFRKFCCSCSQLQNWALCKPSFEPNSIHWQKSEYLQWEKWKYITDIEKTFSDTAQYFHSKHLKNGPKRHENHLFFNGMVFQGRKDIFQTWLRAAPLCQLNQTYRFIMLNQKGLKV
jgi:hypothetical protein